MPKKKFKVASAQADDNANPIAGMDRNSQLQDSGSRLNHRARLLSRKRKRHCHLLWPNPLQHEWTRVDRSITGPESERDKELDSRFLILHFYSETGGEAPLPMMVCTPLIA